MLFRSRTLVGDSAFYQGIRDYWTAHKHGTALTDDLMAAVEQRAGTRLGWFFDQWLRRPGFASLSTNWRYDATARRVLLDIEQDGRFGFYRFPLTIDITDAAGLVQRVRVDVPAVKSASVTLPVDLAAAPRALSFDPDVELLADIRPRRVAPGTSDGAPGTADAALSRGRLDEAEAYLYEATRKAPRDPVTRAALGSFLAARGHLKAGAVLLEEARLFGGDRLAIDDRLGHVYQWLGTWDVPDGRAGATPFWARAAFLLKHPTVCSGRDSSAVRLDPNELAGLGRIALEIGGTSLPADIDARIEGLVLPASSSAASSAERFGTQDGESLAAVYALSIGTFSCRNVPARFEAVSVARIGLDVLAPMAPTFDVARRTLVLRAAPTPTSAGEVIPLLLTFPGVKIVPRTGQPAVSIESAAGRAALRGAVWTFDLRRGSIFVNR